MEIGGKKIPKWVIIVAVIFFIGVISSGDNDNNKKKSTRTVASSEQKWSDYYEKSGTEVIEVQEDILYKYGKYYANKTVLTTVKVESKSSDALKSKTSDNDSYFFSFVFNFEDSDEVSNYNEDEMVTIVGIVEGSSIGKTITLKECHVIASGDKAKAKYEELANNKETYKNYAEQLKAESENAEKEKEASTKSDYVAKCQEYDYNEIQRNPDNYKDKYIKVSGKVIQVSNGLFNSVTLRVNDANDNTWYVTYSYDKGESKILDSDNITVYGKSKGVTTYTSITGASITIPSVKASYIDIN